MADPRLYSDDVAERTGFLGLAQLKTEGEAIVYDPGAGPPLQWSDLPWQDRLMLRWGALGHRLRWLPDRLWWALFGTGDY